MIGAMRNQIELLEPSITRLGSGQMQRTYPDSGVQQMAEVMQDRGGGERTRGQQIEAIQFTTFRIRYPHQEPQPGVTWRVGHRGKTFEVDTVQDRDGRQRWLYLICKEVQ